MSGWLAAAAAAALTALLLLSLPALSEHLDEETIMFRFRQALADANSPWTRQINRNIALAIANSPWGHHTHRIIKLPGWADNSAQPCSWAGVLCNRDGHITEISLLNEKGEDQMHRTARPATPAAPRSAPIPLLPELAQLQWLEELVIVHKSWPGLTSIPQEWTAPGSFRRLKNLNLYAPDLGGPLPDIRPGALPALEQLTLDFQGLQTTLPAGWGSSPAVLPSLKVLHIRARIVGQLPGSWSRGFWQLEQLILRGSDATVAVANGSSSLAGPGPGPAPVSQPSDLPGSRLSAQWAYGFPKLEKLGLNHLRHSGELPWEWVTTGFPCLVDMMLQSVGLTGALPAKLLDSHPNLTYLNLENNQLTGPLPPQWATTKIYEINVANNNLSGPAFPDAWLEPEAMSELRWLYLSGNLGLQGSLPPNLAWPALISLDIGGTDITGSIPEEWCHSLAGNKFSMLIPAPDANMTLPACAKKSLAFLKICKDLACSSHSAGSMEAVWQENHKHYAQAAGQQLQHAATVVALVLAAAGMLAVGMVVSKQWYQQECVRQRHVELGQLEAEKAGEGVPLVQPSCPPSHPHGSSSSLLNALDGSAQFRVPAWLRDSLNQDSHTVGMLDLEELSEGLEHCLQPTGMHSKGGMVSSSGPFAAGRQLLQQQHLRWPADQVASNVPGAAAALPAWLLADALGSSAGSTESRQHWPLPTESLRMSTRELEFVTGDSGLLVVLGTGSHAAVYLARLQGIEVAAKVFVLEGGLSHNDIWCEALITYHCCLHPHTVPLLGVAIVGNLAIFAMQLMPGGSLVACLRDPAKNQRLKWAAGGKQVALDIAEGLEHLHSMQVMHSDLKASNVLLSADGRAAISDLGMARLIHSNARTAAGFTQAYAAPEQLLGQRCTLAADMYSFGVLLIELISLQPAVGQRDRQLPVAPHDCPQEVVDLIQECLSADPHQRPTAAQALQRLQAVDG